MNEALVIDSSLNSSRVNLQRAQHGHKELLHSGIRIVSVAEQELGPQRDLLIGGVVMLQKAVKVVHHGPHGHRLLRSKLLGSRPLGRRLLR